MSSKFTTIVRLPSGDMFSAKISLCGAVDLLATIFGEDQDSLRAKYGLPSVYPPCLNCGKSLTDKEHQKSGLCSTRCRRDYTLITLVCDECGVLFKRPLRYVLKRMISLNYKHVFCTRRCMGKRFGRECGFGIHPENAGQPPGQERKWDYGKVYKLGYPDVDKVLAYLHSKGVVIQTGVGVPLGGRYTLGDEISTFPIYESLIEEVQ